MTSIQLFGSTIWQNSTFASKITIRQYSPQLSLHPDIPLQTPAICIQSCGLVDRPLVDSLWIVCG